MYTHHPFHAYIKFKTARKTKTSKRLEEFINNCAVPQPEKLAKH